MRKILLSSLLLILCVFLIKVGLAQEPELVPPPVEDLTTEEVVTPVSPESVSVPESVSAPEPATTSEILPIEKRCEGLRGLEYRKCLIRFKRQIRGLKTEVKELKQEIREIIDENIQEIQKNIQNFVRIGRNVFVLTPAGRAMAGGKIDNLENNILTLNTLGFTTKWNIENAKGDKDKLAINQEIRISGRWDSANNIFRADHIKIYSSRREIAPIQPMPMQPVQLQVNEVIKQLRDLLKNLQPQPLQPQPFPQP